MKTTLILLIFCLSVVTLAQGPKPAAKPAANRQTSSRATPNRPATPPTTRPPVVQQAPLLQAIPPQLLKDVQDGLTPFRVAAPLTVKIEVPRGTAVRNYSFTIPQGSFLLGRIESHYLILPVKRSDGTEQEVAIDITTKDKAGKPFLQELKSIAPRRSAFIESKRAQVIYTRELPNAEEKKPASQNANRLGEATPPIMEFQRTEIWELNNEAGQPVFAPRAIVSVPVPEHKKINKDDDEIMEGGVMYSSLKSYPDLPALRADTTIKQIDPKTIDPSVSDSKGPRVTVIAVEVGPIVFTNPEMKLDEHKSIEVIDETAAPPPNRSQGAPKPTEPSTKTEAGIATPECNDCGKKDGLLQFLSSLASSSNKLDQIYAVAEKYLGQPINNCRPIGNSNTVNDHTLFDPEPADCVPKTTTKKGKNTEGKAINITSTKNPIGMQKLACDLNADPEFAEIQKNTPGVVANLQAVDICARNCHAEMNTALGSCGTKHEYLKAVVGSVYNRVTDAYGDNKTGRVASSRGKSEFTYSATGLEAHPFINVILEPSAYSVWNEPNEAYKRALCPPTQVDGTFWSGKKLKANQDQVTSFNLCKRECFDAVFDSPKFIQGKENFTQKFYTSGQGRRDFHGMPRMRAGASKYVVKLNADYTPRPGDRVVRTELRDTKRKKKNKKTGALEPVYKKVYHVERAVPPVPKIDGKPLSSGTCVENYDDSYYMDVANDN